MSAHTAVPWRKGATHCDPRRRCFKTAVRAFAPCGREEDVCEVVTSFDESRFIVRRTADEARLNSLANAALIASAVNSHDEMLAALRKAKYALAVLSDWSKEGKVGGCHEEEFFKEARDAIRVAIAKAEGAK